MVYQVKSMFSPQGDQPKAIEALTKGIKAGQKEQVLLGATGTGKTFTISKVIENFDRPVLVLAHNKTLVGQLYSEFKEFFPDSRVEYFVSSFDYYQPEAYIAKRDLYIDKSTKMNLDLEMLRMAAINAVSSDRHTIIVASVACIYGTSSPEEYRKMTYSLEVGQNIERDEILTELVNRQWTRKDTDPNRGHFTVKGDVVDIYPSWTSEYFVRIDMFGDEIEGIYEMDPLNYKRIAQLKQFVIYPAHGYASSEEIMNRAINSIELELEQRLEELENAGKTVEAYRLKQRCTHDIEMLRETGMCPGIENYSRHIDGRSAGEAPYTIIDYFPDDFITVIDESHVMLSQIKGMYAGDRSRKESLVEHGFRLPSALDNRPLTFDEFQKKMNQVIYVSATPGDYELERVNNKVVEQIIRPTGLLDPIIDVIPTMGQIDHLYDQIISNIKNNERTLVTTITVRMAEELSQYFKERELKVAYLHHEIKTLQRIQIIKDLRLGKYDVLIGINLLREGLDIPEVSLIAILDADKEGFLRSSRSLIQIIGRAARNSNGRVLMYADKITDSMELALSETKRRRTLQIAYNEQHNIVPKTINKEVREVISSRQDTSQDMTITTMTLEQRNDKIYQLEIEMNQAARDLDFERAALLRDAISELKNE